MDRVERVCGPCWEGVWTPLRGCVDPVERVCGPG